MIVLKKSVTAISGWSKYPYPLPEKLFLEDEINNFEINLEFLFSSINK